MGAVDREKLEQAAAAYFAELQSIADQPRDFPEEYFDRSARIRFGFAPSASMLSVALALCAIPTSASAQTQDPDPSTAADREEAGPADIVVTAQRREQRLQDVPIAITSLGSEELSQRGVNDISGLVGAAPGVTIGNFAGINSSAATSIRGITGQVLAIGSGQAVAYYLDGVYLPRPDAAFFSLDDVERIEILRGPQGTLYGRNATGGAINIITRDPGDTTKGGVELSYGNFDTVSARASVSGPLGGGFSAGISGSAFRHDGYITNTVTGNKLNDRQSYTVRGKLKYASDDGAFSAILAADYSEDEASPVFKNAYAFPTTTFVGKGDPDEFSSDCYPKPRRGVW